MFFETPGRSGPFTTLVVCTGNICRSPQAAALIRNELSALGAAAPAPIAAELNGVVVRSAGTGTRLGLTPPQEAIDVTRALGADISAHQATPIDESLLEAADLVLTLEREHRKRVVSLLPSVTRRTFTLLEFARVAMSPGLVERAIGTDGSLHDKLRAGVAEAAAMRGMLEPGIDDVPDPYGRDLGVYESSGEAVRAAVEQIFGAIRQATVGGAR